MSNLKFDRASSISVCLQKCRETDQRSHLVRFRRPIVQVQHVDGENRRRGYNYHTAGEKDSYKTL